MSDATTRPRVALLPLYLELYDSALPDLLPKQEQFLSKVLALIRSLGIEVTALPVCRVREQAKGALAEAERAGVDGLITLHLAYSPSLESGPPLMESDLPLLLLDTTPKAAFGSGATVDDVSQNHGIHGVQDLASVLRGDERRYTVAAGAFGSPELARKIREWARAAQARGVLKRMRVARIGEPFAGMGDFAIGWEHLRSEIGPEMVAVDVRHVSELAAQVTADELAEEKQADLSAFDCSGCPEECWERSNRMAIGLRRALEEAGAQAFSMNFGAFDRALGSLTVPFLETSKAMARGMGYAGEGDVLTASLVAVLNRCYGPTTFTEMFCPDWASGRVFMSHMGECNPLLARERPKLLEKDYAFGPTDNPAIVVFPLRPGPGALVNLVPPSGPYSPKLIAADVEIDDTGLEPALMGTPHFWIVPPGRDVADFLERYSQAGGTHHLALTPGLKAANLKPLATMMYWDWELIP